MSYLRRRECPIRTARRAVKRLELAELYRSGMLLEEIGARYGVSREAIRQQLSAIGINRMHGGKTAQKRQRQADKEAKREAACSRRHGCSLAQLRELKLLGKPVRAYIAHKMHAQQRGIDWEFNLWQWWTVWQESGHWHERGLQRGQYVMCRHGDEGPYSVDNVYIATNSQNIRDGYINRGFNLNSSRTQYQRNPA